MEVVTSRSSPSGSPSFDFNRASYLSAPSSPKRFGEFYYLSAPSSPSASASASAFAFCVTQDQESSLSAEDLFHHGKIKPLHHDSAKSPLISGAQAQAQAQGKKAIRDASESEERRGRDRNEKSGGRRSARSLSPYRERHAWEEPKDKEETLPKTSSRKWRLADFLLFRSASEGRGSTKDPLRNFVFYRKPEDPKPGPAPAPKPRRKEPPLSAHELHYARKKAQSQDLKKKTFLPYKQGILGRLAGLGTS
ncbi:hypothetical protein Fmac_000381 [Flemingia macrophylla]|uniref:Uncharacterized protein n=1 Tax=Flemingia macrophylla TaxID=520843 RepID=A0ABD1NEJ8_9FABA